MPSFGGASLFLALERERRKKKKKVEAKAAGAGSYEPAFRNSHSLFFDPPKDAPPRGLPHPGGRDGFNVCLVVVDGSSSSCVGDAAAPGGEEYGGECGGDDDGISDNNNPIRVRFAVVGQLARRSCERGGQGRDTRARRRHPRTREFFWSLASSFFNVVCRPCFRPRSSSSSLFSLDPFLFPHPSHLQQPPPSLALTSPPPKKTKTSR